MDYNASKIREDTSAAITKREEEKEKGAFPKDKYHLLNSLSLLLSIAVGLPESVSALSSPTC